MSVRFKSAITISIVIAIIFGVLASIVVSQTHLNKIEMRYRASHDKVDEIVGIINIIANYPLGDEESIIESCMFQKRDSESFRDSYLEIDKIFLTEDKKLSSEIIYSDGRPLYNDIPYEELINSNRIIDDFKDDEGHALYISEVRNGRKNAYIVRMRFDMDDIYRDRKDLLISIISAYLLLEVIVLVIVNIYIKNDDKKVKALVEACDKLEKEAERQEAFMGAFAHELKTPMTSIIGYADLLRQSNLDDESRLEASNFIFNEGRRLEKLSFKLLDLLLLNKEKLDFKEISLKSIIDSVSESVKPVLDNRNVSLITKAGKGKGYMEPELIKTLLYNLIDNGAKAIENGGTIILKGENIAGGCKFSVIDNGIGLEKEEFAKVTEAFYRVDKSRSRKQGGVGLGLSICSKIIDIHGGEIKFDSILGKGTCVEVTLYNKNIRRAMEVADE